MSGSISGSGAASSASNSADMLAQMQASANASNQFTMAAAQINQEQQETSAVASLENTGAKNISDAAKGQ
ncbi:hypothetical protein [Paraburkholderia caffeinilytica]|uniref:hypothetical protein n=1 Tax=Paraburkholderia caffeinilytica TaxID=1761016 RepID=UPI003DA1A0A3